MSMDNLRANLRRLMKVNSLSIPNLEELSGVSRATISNILNGKADPSYSTLEKISNALKIDQSALHTPAPILKSLRYRTNKSLTAREKSAKETLLYTIAEKIRVYNQIEKYSQLKTFDFSSFPKDPKDAAHRLRTILGISQTAPVTNVCSRLRNLGIKQFYFNFGLSKTFGVSINKDDGGPAIFVNTGTANAERWIFTIFHELGHIILNPESYNGQISEEESDSQEEKAADQFASEFLLPVDVVQEKVKGTRNFSFIEKILEIKQEYSVSYSTALVKYCEAYSRDSKDVFPKFQKIYSNFKKFDFKNHNEPCPIQKDKSSFEDPNFKDCIFEALKNNDIESTKAARILEITDDQIKKELQDYIEFTNYEDLPF